MYHILLLQNLLPVKCSSCSEIQVGPRLRAAASSAAEDLDEGPSELNVERGVDHRVEGTVDVAEPSERAVKPGGHVACPAVGVQYVSHKERQPADEEHPWRSAERGREQAQGRDHQGPFHPIAGMQAGNFASIISNVCRRLG